MKKFIYIFLILISFAIITGCDNKVEESNENNSIYSEEIESMKVIINDQEYVVDLENNETVEKLLGLLPLTVTMNELNGNEKYVNLDESLPTSSYYPKHIEKGDVMLFGDNCLVIFYESFDTTYPYTKIGHISNLDNLGNGNIQVIIEK